MQSIVFILLKHAWIKLWNIFLMRRLPAAFSLYAYKHQVFDVQRNTLSHNSKIVCIVFKPNSL